MLVLGVAAPAFSQPFEVLGTRATGMAGAFVAVADDATAAYWNPAGLATGAFFSLLADHTQGQTRVDPATADAPGADTSATFVGMSTNSLAFSYYRLRINQVARPFLPDAPPDPANNSHWGEATLQSVITHNVALTGVQLLAPGFSLGSTVRYVYGSYGVDSGQPGLTTDTWLDHASGLQMSGQHKADVDVGLKVGGQTVQFGFVARNLLQPTLTGLDGSSIRIDRRFRAGVALRPAGRFVVAADIDMNRQESVTGDRQNVAVGAEHWFGDWLGIRGGARVNLEAHDAGPRAVVGAFGLSLALSPGMYLDGQLTRGRDGVEEGWSVSGRVGF